MKVAFFYLIILLFGLYACQTDSEYFPELAPRQYSFFVAGHTYGKPGVDNVGMHPPFKAKFDFIQKDKKIELGVLTGDVVFLCKEKDWDEIEDDVAELGIPIYIAPGNHDLINRVLFERRIGPTYQSFIAKNDLFIILDAQLAGWNITGDQLLFLQNVVGDNAGVVDNIYVFVHEVLWWEEDNRFGNVVLNSSSGKADTINFWSEVIPVFESLENNTTFFAGDVGAFNNGHEFMYDREDNITFIASGMGGGVRDNFVVVDVAPDKTLSFRLIALNTPNTNSLGRLEDYMLP